MISELDYWRFVLCMENGGMLLACIRLPGFYRLNETKPASHVAQKRPSAVRDRAVRRSVDFVGW